MTHLDAHTELVDQLDERLRFLVRSEGVDPQRNAAVVRRIAEGVVRDHDERSLTGVVAPVPDVGAMVGELVARVSGFGPLQPFLDDPTVEAAMHDPPEDTRAYFRGRCLEKYAEHVAAASWDSVIFDLPGRESLQRVPTIDPLRGSKAHVGELLDRCDTAAQLCAALTR